MSQIKYCCCEPKTAALAIAITYMAFTGIYIITDIIYLSTFTNEGIKISNNTTKIEEPLIYNKEEVISSLAVFMVYWIALAILLYGILEEKRTCFLPWLVLAGMGCTFLTLVVLIVIFFIPFYLTLILLIATMLKCYTWYVIFAFYRSLDMRNPNHMPQVAMYIAEKPMQTSGQPPGIVAYTPGLPTYNEIASQPQNV